MQRTMPIAVIAGVDFYVDAAREELRQIDNPANLVPFTKFRSCSQGFRFRYDKNELGFSKVTKTFDQQLISGSWVCLPALMELDPEGISLRYGIPLEDLCLPSMTSPPVKVIAVVTAVDGQD